MKKVLHSIAWFFRKADIILLALSLICSAFGVLIISSAANSYGNRQFILVQSAAVCLGVVLFVLFSLVELDIIVSKWKWIFAFNILFICTLFVWGQSGDTVNRGWLRFGPIGVQPAEIVKVTFIILLAKQMTYLRKYHNLSSFFSMIQIAAHFLIMFGLILISSGDLGSALVYLFVFIVMLFGGGVKLRWFAIGGALVAAATPFAWKYLLKDYQKMRILAPYVPSVDPTGLGVRWHANQSKLAISGGGLTGQGLYHGVQAQSDFLPSKHTDFIFAIAGEELGLIGCVVIVLLITAVIVRCIYVGVRSNSYMGMVACLGIAGMLIFQLFENVGMCLGLTPVIGITLPFFSYGGSSIVTLYAAMGIVSGVKLHQRPGREEKRHYLY